MNTVDIELDIKNYKTINDVKNKITYETKKINIINADTTLFIIEEQDEKYFYNLPSSIDEINIYNGNEKNINMNLFNKLPFGCMIKFK